MVRSFNNNNRQIWNLFTENVFSYPIGIIFIIQIKWLFLKTSIFLILHFFVQVGIKSFILFFYSHIARSIFTFLQPSYTYSRQDGVANIPISREIIEDGRTQVTYCTRDLTAKDKKVKYTNFTTWVSPQILYFYIYVWLNWFDFL